LWRRIRTGYPKGLGEVLHGALGKSHLMIVVTGLSHIRNGFAVIVWWLLLVAGLLISPWLFPVCLLVPILFLSLRRGSLGLGLYSFANWNVNAWGLITGLLRHRIPPEQPIAAIDLSNYEISDRL